MRSIKPVFVYTFKKYFLSKTYLITTIAIVCIIVFGMLVIGISASETATYSIGIVDNTGHYKGFVEDCNQYLTNTVVHSKDKDSLMAYKSEVLEKDDYAIIVLENLNNELTMKIYSNYSVDSADLQSIQFYFNQIYRMHLGETIGLSEDALSTISKEISSEVMQVDTTFQDNYIITYCMLLFIVMAIVLYGSNAAGEITYAKTNRVMELMITSVSDYAIFLGITLSIGLAGILQFLIILLSSFISYVLINPASLLIDSMNIDFSIINLDKGIMYIMFFVFGYLLYAVIGAGIGSLVNKNEDIIVAVMPVQLLAALQLFTGLFAMINDGYLIKFFSYFPLTTAGTMTARYISGRADFSNAFVALIILIVFLILITFIAIKMFKLGILYYGNFRNIQWGKLWRSYEL